MKKKILCVLLISCISALALSACSSGSKYNYKAKGLPGFDEPLTLEMGYEEFEDNLDYENIKYDSVTDIAEGIPFFTRYSADVAIHVQNGEEVIPKVLAYFHGSDSDYENVISKTKEDVGEPVAESDIFSDDVLYDYIFWYLDGEHGMLIDLESDGDICFHYELVNPEKRSMYEQCMKNISDDAELSEAYNSLLSHYEMVGGSIQTAIDEYGAEWEESTDSFVYFTEDSELFGYPGHYKYTLENPNSDELLSDFTGQIRPISNGFDFDEAIDEDAVRDKLSEMFGEYTIETSNDVEYYRWDDSPFSVAFNPAIPHIGMDLNKDFYLIAPELITELNESAAAQDKTPVDKEILQLPDFEATGGIVTGSGTRSELWEMTKDEVSKRLKSPSTAEFPDLSGLANEYAERGDVSIKHTGSIYYVESYVDSQNSFGATVRTDFLVLFEKSDSGNFKCTDVQFYD